MRIFKSSVTQKLPFWATLIKMRYKILSEPECHIQRTAEALGSQDELPVTGRQDICPGLDLAKGGVITFTDSIFLAAEHIVSRKVHLSPDRNLWCDEPLDSGTAGKSGIVAGP